MNPRDFLVVDASPLDRGAIARALQGKPGIRVREADGVEAALEMTLADMPEVILTDIHLPPGSGFELIRRLRERHQGHAPCALVVLTGASSAELAGEALETGAHEYVPKHGLDYPVLWEAIHFARIRYKLERQTWEREQQLHQLNQELTRKDRLKTRFVANASHELRTPVAAISGLIGLLQTTMLNDEQHNLARNIKACCGGLLSVVDDLIDLAKIEAGSFEMLQVPFHLQETIEGVHRSVEVLALDKGLQLKIEIAPECPAWLLGDPRRLSQILQNFLGNAIKFTTEGSVCTRITYPEPGQLRLAVEDTGVGLNAEEARRVFEPYFQGLGVAAKTRGSGLGLSIVRAIVQRSGGTLGVHSQPDQGSVFWAQLPMLASQERPSESPPGPVPAPVRPYRLLVAEDNPIVARVLVLQLEELGHQVRLAADGLEVLDLLEKYPFDAILMDCQMPHLDGFGATRRIRATRSREELPIIALTANALLGEAERCQAAGMNDYLVKPVPVHELQRLLEHWLELENRRAS